MAKRLLDYDPWTGVATYHEYDHLTKTTVISEQQDVSAALEWAKRSQLDEEKSKKGRKRGMWHVATIPVGVQYKWLKDDGLNVFNRAHQPAILRKLNDPDWRYLRTATGKL